MDKIQIANENMASLVIKELDDNDPLIVNNQPIQDCKTKIKNYLLGIDTNAQIQQETTKGATIDEHKARLTCADICEKVIIGIKPYYLLNNDTTNLAMVDKPYSDLIYGSMTNSLHLMQLIYTKASVIQINNLNPFGLTAQDMTDFGNALVLFEGTMPKNTSIMTTMKTATSELVTLFIKLKAELKKLDILMGPFKFSNNEFWKKYTNARIIRNIGAGQTAEIAILEGQGFVPIFSNNIKPGYTITLRNPNAFPVKVSLTNTPEQYNPEFEVELGAYSDTKLKIPEDFGGVLGNYMMIYNPNKFNKIKVTAILAKGKSYSKANELQGKVK